MAKDQNDYLLFQCFLLLKYYTLLKSKGLFYLILVDHRPSSRESRQELKTETVGQEMKQILHTGLLLGSCSATFLIQPRHTYLGKVVGWTLLYQLIKKMSHRHVHRPTWKGQFFNRGWGLGSVPVPSRCVNLTIKISHLKHNPVFMGYNAFKALFPGFNDPRI